MFVCEQRRVNISFFFVEREYPRKNLGPAGNRTHDLPFSRQMLLPLLSFFFFLFLLLFTFFFYFFFSFYFFLLSYFSLFPSYLKYYILHLHISSLSMTFQMTSCTHKFSHHSCAQLCCTSVAMIVMLSELYSFLCIMQSHACITESLHYMSITNSKSCPNNNGEYMPSKHTNYQISPQGILYIGQDNLTCVSQPEMSIESHNRTLITKSIHHIQLLRKNKGYY